MNVHFLAADDSADDSDAESWLEVLEGSPGPSVQNSRAASVCVSDKDDDTENEIDGFDFTEDLFRSDEAEDHDEIVIESDSEHDFELADYRDRRELSINQAEQETSPSSSSSENMIPRPRPRSLPLRDLLSLDRPLRLNRPEVGDIIGHFHEVYGLCTIRPEQTDYYRSWLCWMYRMPWHQIWQLVCRAPNCVVRAVNYLFSLQNHPFWMNGRNWAYEWYAMHAACRDILEWWNQKKKRSNCLSDYADLEDELMSCDKTNGVNVITASEIESYYYRYCRPTDEETPESNQRRDNTTFIDQLKTSEQFATVDDSVNKQTVTNPNDTFLWPFENNKTAFLQHGSNALRLTSPKLFDSKNMLDLPQSNLHRRSSPPWPPQQVINYIANTFHSFDRRSRDEVDAYEIPFETWIDWIQCINKNLIHQPRWQGHFLWQDGGWSIPSPSSYSRFIGKTTDGFADTYDDDDEDFGLPSAAADYYSPIGSKYGRSKLAAPVCREGQFI